MLGTISNNTMSDHPIGMIAGIAALSGLILAWFYIASSEDGEVIRLMGIIFRFICFVFHFPIKCCKVLVGWIRGVWDVLAEAAFCKSDPWWRHILNSVAIVFLMLLAVPFILVFGSMYCISIVVSCVYVLIARCLFAFFRFCKLYLISLKENCIIPIGCTIISGLIGCCAGAPTGAFIGIGGGLLLGLGWVFLKTYDEIQSYSQQSEPFFSDYSGIYQTNNKNTYNVGNGGSYWKPKEKPWTWKGFQSDSGPREDNFRKDLS